MKRERGGDTPSGGVKPYVVSWTARRFRFWPSFLPFGKEHWMLEKETTWDEAHGWGQYVADNVRGILTVSVSWFDPPEESEA